MHLQGGVMLAVAVAGKASATGPVLYSVTHTKSGKCVLRRFKAFETLDESCMSKGLTPCLPEKHLFGLGMWRPRDEALAERAEQLEDYLNGLLLAGSHETAIAVADFLDLNHLDLACDFLSLASQDSLDEVHEVHEVHEIDLAEVDEAWPSGIEPLPATPPSMMQALFHAILALITAWWVLVVTLALLAKHALVACTGFILPSMPLAERLRARLAVPRKRLADHIAKHSADLPPCVKHLAAVSASTLACKTSTAECADAFRTALAPPLAALFVRLDAALPGGSLSARLPARLKALWMAQLAHHWPQLSEEIAEARMTAAWMATASVSTPLSSFARVLKDDENTVVGSSVATSSSAYSLAEVTLAEATGAPSGSAPTPLRKLVLGGDVSSFTQID